MNHLRTMLLAAAVLIGATSSAQAQLVIDNFNSPNPGESYLINLQNANGYQIATNNVSPGTNRLITLNVTSTPVGPASMSGGVGTFGSNSYFTMSLDNSSAGTSMIAYTFTSPKNFIPNVALGGAVGALQYVSSADSGFGANVPFAITIMTATGNLSLNTTLNLTPVFTPSDIALTSFTGTGDLTQVTGMTLMITGSQAADVALDSINITTPPPPNMDVPAPPAAILALLAIPAVRLFRRTKTTEIAAA